MKSRTVWAPAARARIAPAIVAFAFAGLFTAACDVHGISEPGTLSTLAISPTARTLAVNGTQQFIAVGSDFSGADVSVTPIWSVVAGGGTISGSGMFTAGTTPSTYENTVKATIGSVSSTATVIVTAGPLATIAVSANPTSMVVGTTRQFTAVGMDADGNVVEINPSWTVIGNGGSIDLTTGAFTASEEMGTFINAVRASVGGVAGFATVDVTYGPLAFLSIEPTALTMLAETTFDFSVIGRDVAGNVRPVSPVWSIVNDGGSIDAETGLFTAGILAGTYVNTIRVTSDSISAFATIYVTEPPPPIDPFVCPPFCPIIFPVLTSIVVSPGSVVMLPSTAQQFTAIGYDQFGQIFPTSISWSVVNGGGVIDAGTGVFTSGTVWASFANTIVASSGGRQGLASVTVTGCGDADVLDGAMLLGCALGWNDAATSRK